MTEATYSTDLDPEIDEYQTDVAQFWDQGRVPKRYDVVVDGVVVTVFEKYLHVRLS